MTSPPSTSSWEGWLWRLVIAVVVIELLASFLPKILPSLIVLAIIAVVLRLVWFFTSHY